MNILALHRRFARGNPVYVQNGQMWSGDGELWVCTATYIDDGVYRMKRNGLVRILSDDAPSLEIPQIQGSLGHVVFPAPFNYLELATRITNSGRTADLAQFEYVAIQTQEGGVARVYGCSGYALAAFGVTEHALKPGRYHVRANLLREALKNPNACAIRVAFDNEWVAVDNGSVLLIGRSPMNLKVTDYERLIPDQIRQVWILGKRKLASALKSIKPYTESHGIRHVEIGSNDNEMIVVAAASRHKTQARRAVPGEIVANGNFVQRDRVAVLMPSWRNDAPEGEGWLSFDLSVLELLLKTTQGTHVQIGVSERNRPYVIDVD